MPRISMGAVLVGLCLAGLAFAPGSRADEKPAEKSEQKSDQKPDPNGTWIWIRELEGQSAPSMVKLAYKDGKLTGTYKRQSFEFPLQNGKVEGDRVSFDLEADVAGRKFKVHFEGQLQGDKISGKSQITADEGSLELDWVAKRGIDPADVVGKWTFRIATDDGQVFEPTLVLKLEKDQLKGNYSSPPFGDFEAKEIKLEGSTFSFAIQGENDGTPFKVSYSGKPTGNEIQGTLRIEFNNENRTTDFTGKREAEKKEPAAGEKKSS